MSQRSLRGRRVLDGILRLRQDAHQTKPDAARFAALAALRRIAVARFSQFLDSDS